MAETTEKKYLDLVGLTQYDTKIKALIKEKDDALQANIDAVDTKVGTIPATATSTNVVDYVEEKVEEITSSMDAAELAKRVTQAEKDIDAIEADYLKAADKTELQTNIDTVDDKVDTLIGDDANKSVRTIANEELTKQLIPEGAKESLDTLQEIAAWIQSHPDDASAMNAAIEALKALVGTLPEGITATTVTGYIAELVNKEETRAKGVESGLDTRVTALEDKFGDGDDSVAEQIKKAVAVETTVREAADKALDARLTTAESDITTLKESSHTHANKADLDSINAARLAAWDAAEANANKYTDDEIAKFVRINETEITTLFNTTA